MSDETIRNAVIESASISIDRGFMLSAWLALRFGGFGQRFGGYALYLDKTAKHHDKQCNFAGHYIYRILEIAEVENWDDLKGKTIRVKHDDPLGQIIGIGHIVKDDWFYPDAEFKELKEQKGDATK